MGAIEAVVLGTAVPAADFALTLRRVARGLWRAAPVWLWANSIGISSTEVLSGRFAGDRPELVALREFTIGYRKAAWERALAEHGVVDATLAADLSTRYIAEQARRRIAFPETVEVLTHLRSSHRMGIVTNGASDLQREKVENAALGSYFDVVTASGDIGIGKPDRRVFDFTIERLGASRDAAVMIGDSLERDVAGARAAGIRSVWIDRTGKGAAGSKTLSPVEGTASPDATIADLRELPAVIEAWR